jgi:hypothetical protein
MFVTFAGVVLFVGGLILTIALVNETGTEVPDSQCADSSMRASVSPPVALTCVTSSDPKVLLGVLPLLLGIGMTGVGIWRWIAAGIADSGGGGILGSIRELEDKAKELQANALAQQGNPGASTVHAETLKEIMNPGAATVTTAGAGATPAPPAAPAPPATPAPSGPLAEPPGYASPANPPAEPDK